MIATGTGEVTLADLIGFAKDIFQAGVLSYPRIIDLSHATLSLKATEIRNIAQGVSAATSNGTLGQIGAVAFIARSDEVREMTLLFADRTAQSDRPLRVCASMAEARDWIASLERDKAS
ncbi:MAG: hypothetical protein KF889_24765 [Alphaproteobacteria bacterium]|nr:hypothetical protein [Alphaproteobacteria bacterium]MCW5742671.1 hypothetical protein [Alphaproteobacteria bacterium]